jgi:osmotically inducible lipoprotein OsmB
MINDSDCASLDLGTDRGWQAFASLSDATEEIEMLWKVAVAAATLSMLAASGTSTSDRALSGGAIGAGVGGAAGALTGHPLGGAALGGAAGAATGALTNEHQIDLGKPIWKGHDHND